MQRTAMLPKTTSLTVQPATGLTVQQRRAALREPDPPRPRLGQGQARVVARALLEYRLQQRRQAAAARRS
jgi:hypothetical protein